MVKIGDKVEFLGNSYAGESFKAGKIGTVIGRRGSLWDIRAEEGRGKGESYAFYDQEFKVLPFQVGDTVTYSNAFSSCHRGNLTVTAIKKSGLSGVTVKNSSGFEFYISIDTTNKVEDNEMTKFEVGDSVKLHKYYSPRDVSEEGKIGVIVGVKEHGAQVMVGDCQQEHTSKDENNFNYFYNNGKFELVEESNMKFKVNDIVIDEDGDYQKILAIVNGYYVTSHYFDQVADIEDVPGHVRSEEGARERGFELYEPKTEYTLEEVAKSLGVPVAELRIKD